MILSIMCVYLHCQQYYSYIVVVSLLLLEERKEISDLPQTLVIFKEDMHYFHNQQKSINILS